MWKALDIAQATEVVKGKEGGLDYMIEQGGKNLSVVRSSVLQLPELL